MYTIMYTLFFGEQGILVVAGNTSHNPKTFLPNEHPRGKTERML